MDQDEIKHYKRKERELNRVGETVLGSLVESGDLDVADALLNCNHGFRFSYKDLDRDLLLICARADEHGSVPFLIKHGFDPNHANEAGETALHLADTGEMARALLRAGTSPNSQDRYGNTPLHNAVDAGMATALLEHGADPGIKNASGHTASDSLMTWARADYGAGGYEVVQKYTEAREQKAEMLKSLSGAWKPSDCRDEIHNPQQEQRPEARRRLM